MSRQELNRELRHILIVRDVSARSPLAVVFGVLSVLCLMLGFASVSVAAVADREQANFIHNRLNGTQATDAMLDLMEAEIVAGNPDRAARLAIDGNYTQGAGYGVVITPSGGFYNAVLKNWASPWTNEAMDIFQPLNDYSATVIGIVRDANRPFTDILSANVIYVGNVGGISGYSATDNNHYEELEAKSASLGDPTVLIEQTQSSVTGIPVAGVAGVLTTRAAARAYFVDGTNRAMFRFTILNHFCNDLEQYKDNELPSDRIRQDVSRSPGGDSSIFLNECSGCHTGMDGMAQAFAHHEYSYPTAAQAPGLTEEQRMEMGQLIYTPSTVQPKHLINSGNFRDGHVITNDHWINYWRTGPNAQKIGWLNPPQTSSLDEAVDPAYSEGDGMSSLGQELANTEAFAYCQVKKAFNSICLRDPQNTLDGTTFDGIVNSFKSGYDMKQAFIDIAVHCSSHLN